MTRSQAKRMLMELLSGEDRSRMMRDELLKRISALPANADVGIRIGDDQVDITDVVAWGEGAFGAVVGNKVDLRDVLFEWGLPAGRLERIISDTSQPNKAS